MLLYDVFYPNRTCDFEVGPGYLTRLESQPDCEGAVAVCKNGPPERLVLRGGKWVEERRPRAPTPPA